MCVPTYKWHSPRFPIQRKTKAYIVKYVSHRTADNSEVSLKMSKPIATAAEKDS